MVSLVLEVFRAGLDARLERLGEGLDVGLQRLEGSFEFRRLLGGEPPGELDSRRNRGIDRVSL
jgi:hypothetical protein